MIGPIHFLNLKKKHQSINNTAERLEADLILLEPDDKAKGKGFDNLIDGIIELFDGYGLEPDLRKDYEISEEEIQKVFIEIRNHYP